MNIVDFKRATIAQSQVKTFWTFPPKTSTLTGFKITTFDSSQIVISWGDNTSYQTVNSDELVNHIYSA